LLSGRGVVHEHLATTAAGDPKPALVIDVHADRHELPTRACWHELRGLAGGYVDPVDPARTGARHVEDSVRLLDSDALREHTLARQLVRGRALWHLRPGDTAD